MTKEQFNTLLKYLMLEGSQDKKSQFPAEYILTSKKKISSNNDLRIFNFEEYLNLNSLTHDFARRRSWVGQSSDTEHKRAKGFFKIEENKEWCFNDVSGLPRVSKKTKKRWRDEIPEAERKTSYYLMIETKKK
jgi:G3E family GTPase